MPRANVHIRNEDFETWQMIKNKSEFIHEAIEEYFKTAGAVVEAVNKKTAEVAPVDAPEIYEESALDSEPAKVIKASKDVEKVLAATGRDTCPNGHVLAPGTKRCSWKGCKYSK